MLNGYTVHNAKFAIIVLLDKDNSQSKSVDSCNVFTFINAKVISLTCSEPGLICGSKAHRFFCFWRERKARKTKSPANTAGLLSSKQRG